MEFEIETLGPRRIPSPIKLSNVVGDLVPNYVADDARVLVDPTLTGSSRSKKPSSSASFEIAGPRDTIYFDPSKVHAAIVTCGGLCPGINDVIRSIVMELWYWYGVRNITGIRYGYRGFLPSTAMTPSPSPRMRCPIYKPRVEPSWARRAAEARRAKLSMPWSE